MIADKPHFVQNKNWHPDARFGRDERVGKPKFLTTFTIRGDDGSHSSIVVGPRGTHVLWSGYLIKDTDNGASVGGFGLSMFTAKRRDVKRDTANKRTVIIEWEPNK